MVFLKGLSLSPSICSSPCLALSLSSGKPKFEVKFEWSQEISGLGHIWLRMKIPIQPLDPKMTARTKLTPLQPKPHDRAPL